MMEPTMTVQGQEGPSPASGDEPRGGDNIYDKIGWRQTCAIVWHATPWPLRPIAFPYGVMVYRRLLAASDTLRYLHAMHSAQYDKSWLFRLARPHYRTVERLLRESGQIQ